MFRACSASLLLALCALGCYSYAPIRVVKHVDPGAYSGRGSDTKTSAVRASSPEIRPRLFQKKYLAGIGFANAAERINNMGVDAALRGEFREAQKLFEEAIAEDPAMAAAYNNAAVISELFGREEEAFRLYARACVLNPGNERFRDNFLYRIHNDEN
ncbi:MAG: hypothetical protein EPN93_02300 [Spirochaetes bacterium]|nr:MAG: hypothetical protein EPN93_02300 [Spirochaetota bacterium]